MNPAVLIAAVALFPAFQPGPTWTPEPLLWETPVSWEIPDAGRPGLDFSPEVAAKMEAVRKMNQESGPAKAVDILAKDSELELVLLRAGLKLRAEDLKGAQADYEKILASKNRTSPRALALAGFKNVLRKRIEAGDKSLYGPLIQCLKDEWLNEEALALLPSILVDPQAPAATKTFVRKQEPVMALRLGRYNRAIELWARPSDRSETQWLAQTEYRRGNFKRAAEIRLELALKMPAGRGRSQELTTAFNVLARGGLFKEAGELAAKYPDLKKTADYDWRMGLAALAAGELKAAQNHFEAVLKDAKAKSRHPGARYFLGRTLALSGRAKEAREAYSAVAEGPLNYYHILAKGRLQPSRVNLALSLERLLITGPSGRDRDSLGYFLWVGEKGLTTEGMEAAAAELAGIQTVLMEGKGRADKALNSELNNLLEKRDWDGLFLLVRRNEGLVRNPSPAAKDAWLPLAASLAARGGDYRLAFSLFSRVPANPEGNGKWSHPLIYCREILAARREHGLSPALMLALIRTESAYQFDIMSVSNARGLMQLLPATAGQVARRLGRPFPGAVDLFDPATNISYGSWYLKALIDGFGDESLALAGYNGGPYNIKSMIMAKSGMPLDVFIESLPFEETAKYVKRITEARYIYEMSYLGQANCPDLARPVPLPNSSLPDF